MKFFINELSFIGQADSVFTANTLMKEILYIFKEIDAIRGKNNPVRKHSNLSNCYLTSELTLCQWFHDKDNSLTHDQRSFLLRILTKSPFINEEESIKTKLQSCKCLHNQQDISDSSIPVTVHLQGILISLQSAGEFSEENIIITLIIEAQDSQNRTIHNLTQIHQARRICPRYNPDYSKHDSMRKWENATPMDLSDEDAQKALNQSIEYKDRQRFSYFQEKFYRFHFENTYDDKGYPTYHGYPVKDSDVPNDIKKQLYIH
ncbi:hypothetical protein PCC8801_2956 [Rippkaea orientalis PCC 8801]|uniref:Uncharacterized protein n=1 Tax=Rippkaea orientalis (strain PCC 8801 / RF-1) TaxID=41431 RepID=B7JWA6_RIPO1|nr:hypothetical protein [Rippkaea orientalis]ACK66951.1 hypothetical protein PCC8801_2956 [Rippkaea orientalis PCC 8801]